MRPDHKHIRRGALAVTVVALSLLTPPPSGVTYLEARVSSPSTSIGHTARPVHRSFRPTLAFERNDGQSDGSVRFIAHAPGATVFVTAAGLAVAPIQERGSRATLVRMTLEGASGAGQFMESEPMPGTASHFVGADRAKWQTGIPTFARVTERGVYPGIDVVYYGADGEVEYDFVVAPGGDPNAIRLSFDGADRVDLDRNGDLVLDTGHGALRVKAPEAYQESRQGRRKVAARFMLDDDIVRFELGAFDRSRTLVIDPILAYSSYFGGGNDVGSGCCGHTQPFSIDVDDAGHIFIAGYQVQNSAFPTTVSHGTNGDMFVAKFSPDGATLLYSAVIGGNGGDAAIDMVVDATGNAYIFGLTDNASGFPITASAFQPTYGGGVDTVILKLSADGSTLLYSSFLGGPGNDGPKDIAIDSAGNAYVVGGAGANFPLVGSPFQTVSLGQSELFVAKINAAGTSVLYATLLGSSGDDHFGGDIVVDGAGHAYVAGSTNGSDFPTTPGAFDTTSTGGPDGFIVKLSPGGSSLVYATMLGGALGADIINSISLDAVGNVYVAGWSASVDFPIAGTPYQGAITPGGPGHDMDAFVAKLNPTLSSVLAATFVGGSRADLGTGLALDAAGNVLIAGETYSTDFPTHLPVQATFGGGVDAFVTKLNPSLSGLAYSTYLGGTAIESAETANPSPCCTNTFLSIDQGGNAVVTGRTNSTDFPTTADAYQAELRGPTNAFIARIIETLTVGVDIKPGSFPNSINLGSNGTVAVAILSSDSFDALTVDPLTVRLANASVRLRGNGTPMASGQDINDDGRLDLVVHVNTEALELTATDTVAEVEGETFQGGAIRGVDSVRVVH